jgi:hypothetical protein
MQAQAPVSANSFLTNLHIIGSDRAALRAVRNFWEMEGEQKQERWWKLSFGYEADYSDNGIKGRYVFNERGDWLYSSFTYTENEMPKEVRRIVKRTYYDYQIKLIIEFHEEENVIYEVQIEDATTLKILLVQDGEMEVLHNFNK